MNLMDYGRIIVRRGWIVLLLAAVAAASAYLISTQITPVYRAVQKVLIQPARTDLSLTQSSKLLLNSYRSQLDSSFIAAQVIDRLQLDMTPLQLKGDVTVAARDIDLSLDISADSTDPALAARIAREWGQQFVENRNLENQKVRREDQVNALLQDDAQPSLLQPRPTLNAAIGALLGAILGAVLIFVLEFLESSVIRHRDDLERSLSLPVLSSISE